MAREEIKKLRKILSEIEKAPVSVSGKELENIIKKVGVSLPTAGMDSLKDKCIQGVHTALQTETMLNACVSAEKSGKIAMWSCIFAAIAAIAACISVVLTLCIR